MNILNYRNAKETNHPVYDLEIETAEYGWIPTSIDMDNVELEIPHMVEIAQWLEDNAQLITMKSSVELLNENKESKLIEIEAARNLAIETPVVSSVLGTEHTYQTKASNRQFLNDLITLGIDSKFTCVDMEGNKARVPHTNAQLLVLAEDMQNSITQCFEQFEMLVAQIDSATDQTDFNMIQWS